MSSGYDPLSISDTPLSVCIYVLSDDRSLGQAQGGADLC